MKNNFYDNKTIYYTYYAAFLGMVIGSILFLGLTISTDSLFLDTGLEDFKISGVLNLTDSRLTLYILKRRVCQMILFFILTTLFSYSFAAAFYNFSFGIYFGMVLSSLFLKFAWRGLFYGFACFFPHYLFYFAVIYLIGKCYYFSDRRNYRNIDVNKLQYFIRNFVIFSILFSGLFWESKFQKLFLNYFYQYLV